MKHLIACRHCGQIQHRPPLPAHHRLHCARCDARLEPGRRPWLAVAAASTALVFLPVGLLLPVMRIERLGLSGETSILAGIEALAAHGQWALALLVLLFSVLVPIGKLLGLLVLLQPALHRRLGHAQRRRVHHAVEWSGRWGMVDVLLVAVLVAVVKLGDLVQVHPGPGLAAFAIAVTGSLIAGLAIHPQQRWD